MSGTATTREKRTAAGKCTSCLKRKAMPGFTHCRKCSADHTAYLKARYDERRAKGLCVRCGDEADGAMLCPTHAEERKARRQTYDRDRAPR